MTTVGVAGGWRSEGQTPTHRLRLLTVLRRFPWSSGRTRVRGRDGVRYQNSLPVFRPSLGTIDGRR